MASASSSSSDEDALAVVSARARDYVQRYGRTRRHRGCRIAADDESLLRPAQRGAPALIRPTNNSVQRLGPAHFRVRSQRNAGQFYTVRARSCTCPDAVPGRICKHAIAAAVFDSNVLHTRQLPVDTSAALFPVGSAVVSTATGAHGHVAQLPGRWVGIEWDAAPGRVQRTHPAAAQPAAAGVPLKPPPSLTQSGLRRTCGI